MKNGQYRPRLSKQENDLITKHRDKTIENVLIIGDIHAPFELKGYLDGGTRSKMINVKKISPRLRHQDGLSEPKQ